MVFSSPALLGLLAAAVAGARGDFVNNGTIGRASCAQTVFTTEPGTGCVGAQPPVYPYNAIGLRSTDDSVRGTVLPYGAVMSELWVKDRTGGWRDVVLGYDNTTNYGTDPIHPNFSPVVGRYANRIRNGTFELDGKTYHTPKNENNITTLHGGDIGYDRSSWQIESLASDRVVLSHHDPAGFQGFPGAVKVWTSYELLANATWRIEINATASERTPLMLSSHVYWNLDGYDGTGDGATGENAIFNHTLHLPHADKYVKTDSSLIPTGPLPSVEGTALDFRTPQQVGARFDQTEGVCGANCTGYDTCWVMSHPPSPRAKDSKVIELSSRRSGIKLSVSATNQPAIQVYTCSGINNPAKGSIPRKRAHGGDGTLDKVYDKNSCIVLELEDYIDGINHPKWGRNQIYSPKRPYHWTGTYRFSNIDENGKDI